MFRGTNCDQCFLGCVDFMRTLEEYSQNEKEEHFGRVFKRLRVEKGWSQDFVAAKIGVSRRHVIRLEKGERKRPWDTTLHKIGQLFPELAPEF